jgi:hypothetical protein
MSGKLHDEDYQKFVPAIDAAAARHGKVRLLAQFHDFHGWDAHALWDDIKFATTHCTKIDRIAPGRGQGMGEVDGHGVQAVHPGQGPLPLRLRDRGGEGMAGGCGLTV